MTHRQPIGPFPYPPLVRLLASAVAIPLCLLLVAPGASRAGDPPPPRPAPAAPVGDAGARPGPDRYFDGRWPHTGPSGPAITWIPGEDAWLEWRQDEDAKTPAGAPSDVLFRVAPDTGAATPVVSTGELVAALDGCDPCAECPHGIGRRPVPRLTVAPDGAAVVVRQGGALLRVDLRRRRPPLPLNVSRREGDSPSPLPFVSDVRVAPGGRRISFVRDHDLHAVLVEGDEALVAHEVELTHGGSEVERNAELDWVYPEELDATTAAWWSPDGTLVAYLRLDETGVPRFPLTDPTPLHGARIEQPYPYAGDRNPVVSFHAVGVDGGPPVALDLGLPPSREPYAPWAVWTPDSSRVVVAVSDRAQSRLELRACDPATGRGTPLWRERSDAWVDLPPPPRVLASRDAFLLRSRRDGFWRHWLVLLDGRPPRPLTSAGIDAGDLLAVDEEAGVFFHVQRTADGLHDVVRRVPLDGGEGTTLLDDGSFHAVSFSTTGRVCVDTAARATVPPRVTVRSADGEVRRVLADASTPAFLALRLRPPEFVTLPAADGTPLSAMLWTPEGFGAGAAPHPLVVYGYGGPGSRMVIDAWQGGHAFVRALLDEGFVVMSVDGRGTGGRGKAFETPVHRRLGVVESDDQASAARALAARPGIDGARVGIYGGSYGGFLALTSILRHPETFRAAAAIAPVTDWRFYDSIYTERYMGLPGDNLAGYDSTSIVLRAKELKGATLLLHGLADDNVHVQNTLRLVDACLAANVPVDWNVYPRRGHGIDGGGARQDLVRRVVSHFVRTLGTGAPDGR